VRASSSGVALLAALHSEIPVYEGHRDDSAQSEHATIHSAAHPPPPRIAWLHVPKTGTSFATTLMHFANSSLPKDAIADNGGITKPEKTDGYDPILRPNGCDPTVYDACVDVLPITHATTFGQAFPFSRWFRGVFPVGNGSSLPGKRIATPYWIGDHYGFGEEHSAPIYDAFKGHVFAMFRDPSRRLVSDYMRARQASHFDGRLDEPRNPPKGFMSLRQYARTYEGLTVRMLATSSPNDYFADLSTPRRLNCFSADGIVGARCKPELSRDHLALARKRLAEGFAFVGDTDDWERSICLFHAKFGGKCLAVELINTRETSDKMTDDAAEELVAMADELRTDLPDRYDSVLYADVRKRFEADLLTYNVTAARCMELGCEYSESRRFLTSV